MFKRFRIALLLFILATVAVSTWQAKRKTTSWKSTLHVAVFPINADGSEASKRYIDSLDASGFESVENYLTNESKRYGLSTPQPVRVTQGSGIQITPPPQVHGSALDAILWSLKVRYWAWRYTPEVAIKPDIKLYLLYYDPATHDSVPHSVGLEKGQIGIAHLFATRQMRGSNQVVMTHELLHTLGATDKYDLATTLPVFPLGYAEPDLNPRYPQHWAEIMAGRTPVSETRAEIPASLADTLIGPGTASEIGWSGSAR